MGPRRIVCLALAACVLATLGAACRSQGGVDARALAGLRGETIGVVSLTDVSTLEARYLLQEAAGLDVSQEGSAVTFMEVPPESLAEELASGQIDAAIPSPAGAFRLLSDDRFRVLAEVSKEVRRLAGGPLASSVLLTYPDVAEQKAEPLAALDRLLAQSMAYYAANEGLVLETIAGSAGVDLTFLRWHAERQDLRLGDLSAETQERLLRTWQAAVTLGVIDRAPDLATVLFAPAKQEAAANGMAGGRVTVSMALLDDPSRRGALYAIEQGLVSSDEIDIDLTYLPASALAGAATTKQYDVVEALPLLVPISARQDVGFVVFSAGAAALGSTYLFVRAAP
jgi:ABC-type nitrate/sulfonate/bicarbonate transport system substrate-binding protein